ncbi:MAG: stage II sporulation protein R [Ruminococcus sp.]|nr:stage II sporulation protein R [Ruminococcus sp.]
MKKVIIILFIISLISIFKGNKDIVIPNDAIRFRVIANSNSLNDQQEKMIIKEKVEKDVYEIISKADKKEDVRSLIEDNMDNIKKVMDSYKVPYNINYGYNYFPTKNYKGIMYKAGNYESLVITLGEGLGENFWCVLFPPLCLLESDKEDVGEIEYKSYVKEMLDKF